MALFHKKQAAKPNGKWSSAEKYVLTPRPPQTWRRVPVSTPLRLSNQSSGIREFCWHVPEFTGHAVFAPDGLFLNRVGLCPRPVTCQASCSLVERKALSRVVIGTRSAVLRRCPRVGDLSGSFRPLAPPYRAPAQGICHFAQPHACLKARPSFYASVIEDERPIPFPLYHPPAL